MRVVFDAGDAKVTDDEDVVEGEEVEAEEEEGLRVDISRLKRESSRSTSSPPATRQN